MQRTISSKVSYLPMLYMNYFKFSKKMSLLNKKQIFEDQRKCYKTIIMQLIRKDPLMKEAYNFYHKRVCLTDQILILICILQKHLVIQHLILLILYVLHMTNKDQLNSGRFCLTLGQFQLKISITSFRFCNFTEISLLQQWQDHWSCFATT